jgi:hypothetical protein
MKRIIAAVAIVIGLVVIPATASAQDNDKPDIPTLGNQICDAMMVYDTSGLKPAHEAFELVILDYLGIDKAERPDYREAIRKFWNTHHEQMVCTSIVRGYTSPQHLLKRVVEMRSSSSFYFDYFLQDRRLNVNAVELRGGRKETLVDYLENILARPDAEDIYDTKKARRLRQFLVELMDGKRAEELP